MGRELEKFTIIFHKRLFEDKLLNVFAVTFFLVFTIFYYPPTTSFQYAFSFSWMFTTWLVRLTVPVTHEKILVWGRCMSNIFVLSETSLNIAVWNSLKRRSDTKKRQTYNSPCVRTRRNTFESVITASDKFTGVWSLRSRVWTSSSYTISFCAI